jgi:hypothetical protein
MRTLRLLQVDAVIAIVSVVLLVMEHSNIAMLRSLRVLRAAKALRVLTRSSGMQIIFKSITLSLAAMANVSMVVLLMMVIFAILGVQLLHGKLWHCTDPSVARKHECDGLWLDPDQGQVSSQAWHAATTRNRGCMHVARAPAQLVCACLTRVADGMCSAAGRRAHTCPHSHTCWSWLACQPTA